MSVAQLFGDNLRRCRKRVGLSQEDAAVLASLHRTAVGQLERGERLARMDTVAKLAGALEVDPSEFFKGIEWRPGTVRIGRFVEEEIPGLGTVHHRVDVDVEHSPGADTAKS